MQYLSRNLLIAGLLGLGLAAAGPMPAAHAREVVVVTSRIAPPPPRFERVPPPRHGYVWAPGYWRWQPRLQRHVWVGGYWLRGRPGYRYAPARWERSGPGWRYHDGGWVR